MVSIISWRITLNRNGRGNHMKYHGTSWSPISFLAKLQADMIISKFLQLLMISNKHLQIRCYWKWLMKTLSAQKITPRSIAGLMQLWHEWWPPKRPICGIPWAQWLWMTKQSTSHMVYLLPNPPNWHPIAHPWGQDMGCPLWVKS